MQVGHETVAQQFDNAPVLVIVLDTQVLVYNRTLCSVANIQVGHVDCCTTVVSFDNAPVLVIVQCT